MPPLPASAPVTVVFTAANRGELRPCGCPGGVYGGLAKRATLFQALEQEIGHFTLVDAGDTLFPDGPMADAVRRPREAKALGVLRAYAAMGYAFIADTPSDRTRASAELRATAEWASAFLPRREPAAGQSANIVLLDSEAAKAPTTSGPVIALTARSDADLAGVLAGAPDVWAVISSSPPPTLSDPAVSLVDGVPVLRPTPKGKEFGVLRIWEEGADVLPAEVTTISADKTLQLFHISAGHHRMDVEFRRVPRETADRPDVDAILTEAEADAVRLDGADPSAEWEGQTYASVGACVSCHEPQARRWQQTGHARAWVMLQATHDDQNLDCVACHSTGYAQEGGFLRPQAVGMLSDVQCEVCHGPSVQHVYAPENVLPPRRTPDASVCLGCHQADRSRPFVYAEWLPRVACPVVSVP